jgi:ParB-like nuclease domain
LTDAPQSAGLVALADRIELWPIENLRPYERNPRTHSEAQVDQIAASMVEFGWTNPVLIDEQGGILAGHGRLIAARKLGLAEVPVIRFEHLSEAQKRAYLIADNQLALQAGWSEELLGQELAWLRDENFDLDLVGFDATELERLLAIAGGEIGSDDADDEVPEPPAEPVSKPGDLWALGNHRLLCGDATALADVERVLAGQLADMTFCDPPYNVDYANTPKDKLRGKHRPILNDDPRRRLRSVPLRRLRQHPERHQGRLLHLHEQLGAGHAPRRCLGYLRSGTRRSRCPYATHRTHGEA